MSTQVYYHRLRRIYDYYLKSYFRSLDKSDFDTPEKIMKWNDIRAMNQLFAASQDAQAPGHKWAERIINRRHHKDVFSLDEGDTYRNLRVAARVYSTRFSDNLHQLSELVSFLPMRKTRRNELESLPDVELFATSFSNQGKE